MSRYVPRRMVCTLSRLLQPFFRTTHSNRLFVFAYRLSYHSNGRGLCLLSRGLKLE